MPTYAAHPRVSALVALLTLALLSTALPARADDLPARDRQVINTMIDRVGKMTDIRFIRKGSEHSAADAASFMKGKWNWWSNDVHSVKDFVTLMSAGNFGTGTPYYIKLKDGTRVAAGKWLTDLAATVRKDLSANADAEH